MDCVVGMGVGGHYPVFAGADQLESWFAGEPAAPTLSPPPPHPLNAVASKMAIAEDCNAALTSMAKSFIASSMKEET